MEKVYVAEVKNGYALVFTDEYTNNYPSINSSAKSKGWISVENLLLWEKCPQNKNLIFQKGLVVGDPSKNSNLVQNPPFITEPSSSGSRKGNAYRLEILFIMKTLERSGKTYYLLAREMTVKERAGQVQGWLSEDYITLWDQRLCLEPTTASQNFEYYKNLQIFPAIYEKADESKSFYSSKQQGRPFWIYKEFSKTRMNAYTMRAPILSKEETDIYRVASIASIEGAGKKEKQQAEDEEDLEEWKKVQSNINIIFVIDATSSMKNYYSPVAKALEDIMRRDWEGKNLKVGVVIYRNAADGSREIEYLKISTNINSAINYIASVDVGSGGKTHYESLYKGLETALDIRKMGYEANQSNFMIVIGDAGNIDNGNETNIARKMADNRINLLVFQVNHLGYDAYDDFATEMGTILNKTIQYRGVKDVELKLQSNRLRMVMRKNSKIPALIYGGIKFANPGNSESTSVLKNDIISNVKDFISTVEGKIATLSGGGLDGDNSADEIRLREILAEFGWEQSRINNYITELKGGGVTKLIGSAPVRVKGTNYSLFDYVLFFSSDELSNIIKELKKLESNSHISNRKAYQDAVISMGQAFLGQMTKEDIAGMSMDELIRQIYGVPIQLSSCGVKIEDIIDKSKVSDSQLQSYIDDFNSKRRRLENINNNPYAGKFSSNGLTYIWIPLSEMPGYCAE
jgi:Mg-chelatase subunit ChlD